MYISKVHRTYSCHKEIAPDILNTFVRRGLKNQNFTKNVSARWRFSQPKNFAVFESQFRLEYSTQSQTFHQLPSLKNVCSQLVSSLMPSLRKGSKVNKCKRFACNLLYFSFPVPSGAPRQLKFRVVNSSSIVVRWSEPLQQQDGRIQGYSVFYQKVDDQGNQLNPPPLPEVKYSESWNSLVSIPCLKFQKVVFDEEHLRAWYFDHLKNYL